MVKQIDRSITDSFDKFQEYKSVSLDLSLIGCLIASQGIVHFVYILATQPLEPFIYILYNGIYILQVM